MKAEHTPGPWKVVGPTAFIFTAGDPYGHGSMHVAQVRGWGHLTGRGGGCAFDEDKAIAIQEANANLIAAAPELLDELQNIANAKPETWGDEWRQQFREWAQSRARAAIAKAEGRA